MLIEELSAEPMIYFDRVHSDDSNPGTRESPVRSMSKAMDLGHNITEIAED